MISSHSQTLIDLALAEDLSDIGDLTSQAFIHDEHVSQALVRVREPGVISGQHLVVPILQTVDSRLSYEEKVSDGTPVDAFTELGMITGPSRSILSAERTVLNFLQRLSGVATVSRSYANAVAHTEAVVLDTRKTTPGWRALEKQAVADGGATNHRIGLYDAVMVKDNHLVCLTDQTDLARHLSALRAAHPELKIEFEADHLQQVEVFLQMPEINAILLDNMSNEELRAAVDLRDRRAPHIKLEASGGVTLDTIVAIAETGVDFISVGALTHSVKALDIGLDYPEHEGSIKILRKRRRAEQTP